MPDTRGPYTEPGPIVEGRRPGVVEERVMIARMWRGWVRTEQANAYVAYITGTGLREYAATPGNLGCQMWTRDLGDGRTEVLTVSWWESRAAIELARAVADSGGLTAKAAACALYEKKEPTRADIEKARRKLDRLTEQGRLIHAEGHRGGGVGEGETRWLPA
jgi:hypothetical protein